MQSSSQFIHERSYSGIRGLGHRSRLQNLLRIVRELGLPETGKGIDLGCSNGFVIETLGKKRLPGPEWTFTGLDHKDELLALARQKHVPGAMFGRIDLNKKHDLCNEFDLVMCLETLEHVGNYREAIATLDTACKPNGVVLISVPNEKGLPGLVKYLGRKALRPGTYEDFFGDKSELDYLRALVLGKPLQGFRYPPRDSWGPHLGFDYREFELHLAQALKSYALLSRQTCFFGFNIFYVYKKRPT